jgi:ubiquitin carboxyl-terminal hydrolase 4/11/15
MSERSYSHKSDGRQSSTGHSVHSMTSGRANSLTGLGPSALMEPPGLAPGLFILGSVPAIIRCWLDTNFKHDTLLYAAVCTGSFTSYVDLHLIELLGLQDQMTTSDEGVRKIKISIYLPEAVPVTGSSRSNSPAPQLPSVAVEFTVRQEHDAEVNQKAIQIFLGSDMLRAHSADLLFSTNQLTLYDDDHCKLQIPFVRPEDERTFKSLTISSKPSTDQASKEVDSSYCERPKQGVVGENDTSTATRSRPRGFSRPSVPGTTGSDGGSIGLRSLEQRPTLGLATSARPSGTKDVQDQSPTSAARPSPATLDTWRRRSTERLPSYAKVGEGTSPGIESKPREIKVLRPSRTTTRTGSTSSPSTSQSRFFDDGKRRGEDESTATQELKRSVSGEKPTEHALPLKSRSANPVGGASAFAWLNNGGSK